MRIKTSMPIEYRVSAVIAWSICLVIALATAVPYWAGHRALLAYSGMVYPVVALLAIVIRYTYYRRRFGTDAEIQRRLNLAKREQIRYSLLIVAGAIPFVALMVIVWVQAWPLPHN